MKQPIRLMHIITGLEIGGAERSLHELLRATDRDQSVVEVVCLTREGPIGERIRALGVPVHALGLSRSMPNPLGIVRLSRMIRRFRPDVIQTWMYHADLLGGLAAKLAGGVPVAWGIRHCDFDWSVTSARTRHVVRTCARLSRRLPRRIVSNSRAAKEVHASMGYDASRIVVIPNGFDLDIFRPDPEARRAVRNELGVPDDAVLIGAAGRFHPVKGHATFAEAAGLLAERDAAVRFLLCGDGVDESNVELASLYDSAVLRGRVSLLGRRDDMPRVLAALDVATSASYEEAFPRVIGEAMACAVPCVATDVGDSTLIIGETGRIVQPRDPGALADAWGELVALEARGREALGEAARRRVRENYEIHGVARRFGDLHAELAARAPAVSNQPSSTRR